MSAARKLALFLPSLGGGGAERVYVDLANEFAARGLGVDLVLASAHGPYTGEVSRDVRIVDFGVAHVSQALPGLVRYLRSERPTAMLSGLDNANVVAVLACHIAGRTTRCAISMRSVPTEVYRRATSGRGRWLFRIMKVVYRFADAIIANSQAVALDASQLLRIPAARIEVIYNPLNLARIERDSRRPLTHAWFAPGAPPVVLGVGSLTGFKDFDTLIRAFAVVRARRNCRLVILGEGPAREKLESLAREEGIAGDILMPGFVPNPFPWMRQARVFVSSSVTEGCPNALMQALALGTPIVSTNAVGGSAEVLDNGRWGRMVAVGRPDAMAAAIDKSLIDGARTDSRTRAAQFSHDRIARQYLGILMPTEAPA